ncbi:Transposon Ty3-G Gag-Pol poly, partial [Paramuricea clavata]
MARRTKTLLPISDTLLKPSVIEPSEVTKRLSHYRQQSKKYYDRTAKPLPNLQKGDVVRVTDIKGKYMKKGTVINETSYPRSYMVNINGRNYRRNRRHLLKVKEEPDSEHEYDTIVEPINQQETIVEQTNWQETIVKPSQVTDHQDDHERQHEPYSEYIVTVNAVTNGGIGSAEGKVNRTEQSTPGKPGNVQLERISSTELYLTWTSPSDPNGVIIGYRIVWSILRDDKNMSVSNSVSKTEIINNGNAASFRIDKL